MKIAIHNCPGSFSDDWISYCKLNNIEYKAVNCSKPDIVHQVKDCQGLMWHWPFWDTKYIHFARQLTHSLENIGMEIYPSIDTAWHYDDKLGQKYLFESIEAPLIPSYVFYDQKSALKWAKSTTYPKVFKLRCGASSMNVRFVKNYGSAKSLIKKAFGKGFLSVSRFELLCDRIWQFKRDKNLQTLLGIGKGIYRLIVPTTMERTRPREVGYVYFQDFIEGLDGDFRIIVIGNKAFALKRLLRRGDFRASGSGLINYSPDLIDPKIIAEAFKISDRLDLQSAAFDFVMKNDKIYLIEVSYAFMAREMDGYWNRNLEYVHKQTKLLDCIIENFIEKLKDDKHIQ